MSTTFLIVLSESILMCLYGLPWLSLAECSPLAVFGLFNELKAFDRFLHISSVSVNRNNTRWSPRPLSPSLNSITSHLPMNDRCDDTRCGGQLSISLKISNITSCPSVFLLSSLMYVITSLILLIDSSKALWSGLFLFVCLRISVEKRMIILWWQWHTKYYFICLYFRIFELLTI